MGVAEVETLVPGKVQASHKVKVKILAKKPLTGPCDLSTPVPMKECMEKSGSNDKLKTTKASNTKHNYSVLGLKRGIEGAVEVGREKKARMDRSATFNCRVILVKLIKSSGRIFSQPVNPVKLGIPDYFDIIKNPMDLGTIKQKLDRSMYKDVEEFESDVRLTFSNAMEYNPPGNQFHGIAKDMMAMFDNLWKPVKAKTCRQRESIKQLSSGKKIDRTMLVVGSQRSTFPGQTMLSIGKTPKEDISIEKEQKIGVKAVEDGKAKVSVSSKARPSDPDSCGITSTISTQPQISQVRSAQTAVKMKYENSATCSSAVPVHGLKVDVKGHSASHVSRSDPDSDGCVSCLDEEYACATSAAGTTGGLKCVLDIPLSPSKALRAATLKSRFAYTILKAQHKTLLQPGDATDMVKLQQEKERLERRQREEKARIEAQIRAAESAARLKAELELKRQRTQEREAARIALEMVERSIDLDDNFHVLRELETLIGSSSLFRFCQCQDGSGKMRNPLERLGLFIKAEYMVGDVEEEVFLGDGDWEEGEVAF